MPIAFKTGKNGSQFNENAKSYKAKEIKIALVQSPRGDVPRRGMLCGGKVLKSCENELAPAGGLAA